MVPADYAQILCVYETSSDCGFDVQKHRKENVTWVSIKLSLYKFSKINVYLGVNIYICLCFT